MTSLQTSFKQTNSLLVVGADLSGFVYQQNASSGSGGSFVQGTMTLDSVCVLDGAVAGDFLRDCGKTVVTTIDGETVKYYFRKVQLVGADPATDGVSGKAATGDEYGTGYIILASVAAGGSSTDGLAARVYAYPSLM